VECSVVLGQKTIHASSTATPGEIDGSQLLDAPLNSRVLPEQLMLCIQHGHLNTTTRFKRKFINSK